MQRIPPSIMALRQQGFPTSFPEGFTSYEMKILGKCLYPNERQSLSVCGSHWAGSCPSPAPPLVFLNSAQWGLCSKAEQNVCLEFSGTITDTLSPPLALKISLFLLLSSHPPLWSHLYSLLLRWNCIFPMRLRRTCPSLEFSPLYCVMTLGFCLEKAFQKKLLF